MNWWIIRRLAKLMIPVLTQKSSLYDLKLYAINLLKYFKRHIWLNFDNNVRKNRMRSLVKFFLSKSGAFNYMTTTKDERMLRCYSFYTVGYIVACDISIETHSVWFNKYKGKKLVRNLKRKYCRKLLKSSILSFIWFVYILALQIQKQIRTEIFAKMWIKDK